MEPKDKLKVVEDGSVSSSSEEIEREKWGRKAEYMLSMLGYCVGLGNLWRFPYLCMKNGGGAFLIPFLFVLLACGLPLYFLEVSLGQFTGKGAAQVWEVCPIFKGIGIGMIVVLCVSGLYYNIIVAWTLHYLGSSFINPLPWTDCNNNWNTGDCIRNEVREVIRNTSVYNSSDVGSYLNGSIYNVTGGNSSVERYVVQVGSISPEEDYWQRKVLHISRGIHEVGGVSWELFLCFAVAWLIVYLCLWKGVKSIGKVVYVTATLPYILLMVILIRSLTLPGSADGIVYFIKPDFHKLLEIEVWIEAALQVFYSLGPAWGPLITMASYNRFNNNCYRDAVILTLASEGTSIYGGFVVFSVLGFMALKSNIPIQDVVKSGPGLGFIAYPEALAMLPGSNVWAVLFFFMLLTTGLDSQFAVMEVICGSATDYFPNLRKKRELFTAIVCAVFFLAGIVVCTQGGMYIFQILDWYVASLGLPLCALLECLIFGWIYGAEMFSRDIELMIGRSVPVLMRIMWCFVTPFLLLVMLFFTFVTYKPPNYGDYEYPVYAEAFGWLLSFAPVMPLPIVAVKVIKDSPGYTLLEKLKNSTKPSTIWQPVSQEEQKGFTIQDRKYHCGLFGRIKLNILGRS